MQASKRAIKNATVKAVIELVDSERMHDAFYDTVGSHLGRDIAEDESAKRDVDQEHKAIIKRLRLLLETP